MWDSGYQFLSLPLVTLPSLSLLSLSLSRAQLAAAGLAFILPWPLILPFSTQFSPATVSLSFSPCHSLSRAALPRPPPTSAIIRRPSFPCSSYQRFGFYFKKSNFSLPSSVWSRTLLLILLLNSSTHVVKWSKSARMSLLFTD